MRRKSSQRWYWSAGQNTKIPNYHLGFIPFTMVMVMMIWRPGVVSFIRRCHPRSGHLCQNLATTQPEHCTRFHTIAQWSFTELDSKDNFVIINVLIRSSWHSAAIKGDFCQNLDFALSLGSIDLQNNVTVSQCHSVTQCHCEPLHGAHFRPLH